MFEQSDNTRKTSKKTYRVTKRKGNKVHHGDA